MNKDILSFGMGVLLFLCGCSPVLLHSQSLETWTATKIQHWQEATKDFLAKNTLEKERLAKHYMQSEMEAVQTEKGSKPSNRERILNFAYSNYKNSVLNSTFFITETVSTHGSSFMILLDKKETQNLIKLKIVYDVVTIVLTREIPFDKYEDQFSPHASVKKCDHDFQVNRLILISRFDKKQTETKLVPLCTFLH